MTWSFFRKIPLRQVGSVLLLIDWDNFRSTLQKQFGIGKVRLDQRIGRTLNWVKGELGELLAGHGFVFAPEHLNELFRKMCAKNNLRTVTCPKRDTPDRNGSFDSVDETLIWFGKMMLAHPDVKCLCIISGDKHYIPLMEAAKKQGVSVAFAVPSRSCFSETPEIIKKIIGLISINPKTGKKMYVELDTLDLAG